MDLDLARRAGLPEHLRVLSKLYPRDGWTRHDNFDDLTRFWLDRHLMFREIHRRLQEETEGYLDGNREVRAFAAMLHRLAGLFINELHMHHTVEDTHYFPKLVTKDARIASAFELLDSDHHRLDSGLEGLTSETNAVLQTITQPDVSAQVGALLGRLEEFGQFLDRHLTDEEEIVVPIILEYGSVEV